MGPTTGRAGSSEGKMGVKWRVQSGQGSVANWENELESTRMDWNSHWSLTVYFGGIGPAEEARTFQNGGKSVSGSGI